MATKPTKKDFAKELADLILVVDEMTDVMKLCPPIPTDYNLDLKNKKVTNVYLQKCISDLQVEIKKSAEMIEWDKDKFSGATLERLKILKVKVPDVGERTEPEKPEPKSEPEVKEAKKTETAVTKKKKSLLKKKK